MHFKYETVHCYPRCVSVILFIDVNEWWAKRDRHNDLNHHERNIYLISQECLSTQITLHTLVCILVNKSGFCRFASGSGSFYVNIISQHE